MALSSSGTVLSNDGCEPRLLLLSYSAIHIREAQAEEAAFFHVLHCAATALKHKAVAVLAAPAAAPVNNPLGKQEGQDLAIIASVRSRGCLRA